MIGGGDGGKVELVVVEVVWDDVGVVRMGSTGVPPADRYMFMKRSAAGFKC